MLGLALGLVGVLLIALRRPLGSLIHEWRKLFPPRLQNERTKAGEIFLALLGVFCLFLAVLAVAYG
jgi:hypothetical protein